MESLIINKAAPAIITILVLAFSGCNADQNEMGRMHDGEPIVFNPDGGWCWFQDERAIIDNDRLIFGSVSSTGDIILTVHNFNTGHSDTLNLHPEFQKNDHAQPALWKRPDGRFLIAYSRHNDDYKYWRISGTDDPAEWQSARQVDVGDRVTYSNIYHLSEPGRTYNFHRGIGWHPNAMISDDYGDTWQYAGRLMAIEGHRPYPRYTSNGRNEIHFITTEAHPRDYPNSIYHGYIRDDRLYTSDGIDLGKLDGSDTNRRPSDFTRVFEGDENNVAWTSDIELDANGYPYIAYSVTKDPVQRGTGGMDHRYRYARWDGNRWNDYEIAYAGTRLYSGEDEYTGLISLHPDNPDIVYISTDADPVTGTPLISETDGERHYEIFRGVTADEGATWQWMAVTTNSTADNIRPIVTSNGNRWSVLWLRGEYRTYTDYNLEVVGYIFSEQ